MKANLAICLLAFTLVSCASGEKKEDLAALEQEKMEAAAAASTEQCLDNPELAKIWGDCNVKATLFDRAEALAECRKLGPKIKGGHVPLELRVKPDGQVKSVKILKKNPKGKFELCLAKEMRKLKFAPPPRGTEPVISLPYQL